MAIDSLNLLIFFSIGLITFLCATAFFSALSTSFFELDRDQLKKKARSNSTYTSLLALLAEPLRLTTTFSIAGAMSTISFFLLSVFLTEHLIQTFSFLPLISHGVNAVFFITLIFFVSEIFPKLIPAKYALELTSASLPVVKLLIMLFYPLSMGVMFLTKFVEKRSLRLKEMKSISTRGLSHQEIKDLAKQGFEKGELKETEFQLIENIIDFHDQIVRKVMTPRADIFAINIESSVEDVIDLVTKHRLSRIPLYEEDLDHIHGVIYAKDLLKFLHKPIHFSRQDWIKLSQQALFVPETQQLGDVLKTFKKKRIHIAIVVDEYGNTSGLVTLDDILEEITGKLGDIKSASTIEYRKLSDTSYWVDARMPIDEVFDILELNDDAEPTDPLLEDIDTLGGLILKLSGSIPQQKQHFRYKHIDIVIDKVHKQRIQSAILNVKLDTPNNAL